MKLRLSMRALAVGLAAFAAAPAVLAQEAANAPDPNHPGKAIYDRTCASCHNNPGQTRAAAFSELTATSAGDLRSTLTEGNMRPMAASLSANELTQLVGYLTSGQKAAAADWTEALMCPAGDRAVNVGKSVSFSGFGTNLQSTRDLSAKQAGLTKADMSKLEIAWAIGIPKTPALGTGAAVLGDTVYINTGGKLLALDGGKGCARWVKDIGSRNTPEIANVDGRKVLAFSAGRGGDVVMLDAKTGEQIWKANAQPSNGIGSVRGGVVVYKDKVIVPISASGVGAGMNPKFECCTGHGAVIALSAKDGSKLWEYNTMKDAEYTGQVSKAGVKQRGPSGAPIWGLPTIDAKRNRVIVATGENTSHPSTDTSDAIIALDLDTGKVVWNFQAMSADVWNMSCNDTDLQKSGPNCPRLFGGAGRDFDFGATPMLLKGAGGLDIVVNGQKSGHVWAIDAETGHEQWSHRIGEGTALGGVHWGVASDGKYAFVPVADSLFGSDEQDKNKAGVYAFRLTDGRQMWAHVGKPDCDGDRKDAVVNCETKFGFSAAPLVIDGAVVTATLDGKVVVFDGKTGKVLKTIDTIGPVKTVNGVPGNGGSIDSHAISAGDGMIFVTSGYGSFSQTPGNVLIALKPKK